MHVPECEDFLDNYFSFLEQERVLKVPAGCIEQKTVVHSILVHDPKQSRNNKLVPGICNKHPQCADEDCNWAPSSCQTDPILPPPGTAPLGTAKPPKHRALDSVQKMDCLPSGTLAGRKKKSCHSA